MMNNKKIVDVDVNFGVTPRWVRLMPAFIQWLEKGTDEQKAEAKNQLNHMALICDYVVDSTLGRGKEQKQKVDQAIRTLGKN